MTDGRLPLESGDREFFSIQEACRVLGVSAHTLRYWETRFRILRPNRLPGGHRRYAKKDIETALKIRDLIRGQKLTVEGARRVLALERRGGRQPDSSGRLTPASLKLLRELRDELKRLASELGA